MRTPTLASLVLLASIVISFLAGSSAPTPLYAVYQSEWHFSPIMTTVIFGVYAIAVLAGLLVLGRISDHIGRRPVLLAALGAQVIAMVLFASADSTNGLIAGRVVQGIATGGALGALGAAMLDVDRRRGTLANSAVPGVGTGLGAILSALAVQFLPAPTHLIYLLLIAVFAVQAVGVVLMPETVPRAPGLRAALKPELQVPAHLRRAVLTAAPVLFAAWALAGFYGSLAPALARELSGSTSVVLGGLGLFVLAGVAVITTVVLDKLAPRTVMLTGVLTLIVGVLASLTAVENGSATGLFLGTAVAGVGFGAGFQGGIRTVVPLARAHERSGVLSVIYVVSYLGMGVPAVLAGVLVVHGGGLIDTARDYSVFVLVLAVLALFGLLTDRGGDAAIGPAAPVDA
ncbi:MAG: MFS transporter [Jatrophihabitantaceae bacterium]